LALACRGRDPNRREEATDVPDETRHESADLTDYSVAEPSDSLTEDDPTERGVATPERWSAAM